jgi:restriction endonuclease S subunit
MSEVKERYLVRPQDLVMRTRGQITTAAEVNQDLGMAVVSGPLFRIRVESDMVLPSYLTWYINQPAAQAYLTSRAKGTSVQMISKRAVEEMEMPLPSLEEQRKIMELAGLAAREQRLLRQLAEKRKQYMETILLQLAMGHTEKGEG